MALRSKAKPMNPDPVFQEEMRVLAAERRVARKNHKGDGKAVVAPNFMQFGGGPG